MTQHLNEQNKRINQRQLINWLAGLVVLLFIIIVLPPGSLPYPRNADVSDAAIAHWPAAHYLRSSVWEHGQWPLWNQGHMLGLPFAANPLNKVWYPPQWLVLLFPPTLHLNFLIYAHMIWLVAGMLYWAKTEQLQPLVGLFAAIAWGLNPKLIGHLGAGHLDIVYALAWVPWLLITLRQMLRSPGYQRALHLSLVTAMLALADVRMAFYFIPVTAVYSLASWADERGRADTSALSWKLGAKLVVSVAVFLLLFAVQLVPLLTYGKLLTRSLLTVEDAGAFSLPVRYLLGLFIPDYGGFHEWMVYCGITVLALAALGTFSRGATAQRKRIVALVLVATVALLWALGSNGPLFDLVAHNIPLISWFRVPSRALFLVSYCLILVASYGLNAVLTVSTHATRLLGFSLGVAGLTWLVGILVLAGSTPAELLAGVGVTLLGSGAGLWLAGGGLSRSQGGQPVGIWLLIITLTLSLVAVDVTLIEGRHIRTVGEAERAILEQIDTDDGRIYSPSFDFIGVEAARAGVLTVHGVDPFQLQWSAEVISKVVGTDYEHYCITLPCWPEGNEGAGLANPDIDVLNALGTRWIIADYPVEGVNTGADRMLNGLYVYELASSAENELRRLPARSPNVAFDGEVDTSGYAEAVTFTIVQAYAPGWKATVDGQRVAVLRVEEALIGIELPPGKVSHVRLAYRPTVEYVGLAISGLTIVVLVAVGFVFRRRTVDA